MRVVAPWLPRLVGRKLAEGYSNAPPRMRWPPTLGVALTQLVHDAYVDLYQSRFHSYALPARSSWPYFPAPLVGVPTGAMFAAVLHVPELDGKKQP